MANITVETLKKRNQDYINNLGNNVGRYLNFLSVMSKFHKYPVEELASFALDAPQSFTAVAEPSIWQNRFKRPVSDDAKGINIVRGNKIVKIFDVSETEETSHSRPVKIWQYDDNLHENFIYDVVNSKDDAMSIIAHKLK